MVSLMGKMIGNLTPYSSSWIACNVYVSAGKMVSKNFLCDLLSNAQKEARDVAVVHAFADGPYDRSSFHFAGCSREMVSIVSKLACDAMFHIPSPNIHNDNDGKRHPTVGKVDHISIMPLNFDTFSDGKEEEETSSHVTIKNHCVPAAHDIGKIISSHTNQSCQILYYGYANEEHLPLAQIRKLKTHFFNSSNDNNTNTVARKENDMCIIGVPPNFVENVNVRLRSGVTKKDAIQHVTKYVRSRDGGMLSHVEALTLPYGPDQYEVACNLINPNITNMDDIQKLVLQKQKENNHDMVESIYRVGTTVDQCIQVLSQDKNQRQQYNEFVLKQFKNYFENN